MSDWSAGLGFGLESRVLMQRAQLEYDVLRRLSQRHHRHRRGECHQG